MLYGADLGWTPINMFLPRKTIEKLMQKLENHMIKYCYYCNNCEFCKANKTRCAELKRMGFWIHNKNVEWWDSRDPLYNKENEKFTVKPLKSNFINGLIDFHSI